MKKEEPEKGEKREINPLLSPKNRQRPYPVPYVRVPSRPPPSPHNNTGRHGLAGAHPQRRHRRAASRRPPLHHGRRKQERKLGQGVWPGRREAAPPAVGYRDSGGSPAAPGRGQMVG